MGSDEWQEEVEAPRAAPSERGAAAGGGPDRPVDEEGDVVEDIVASARSASVEAEVSGKSSYRPPFKMVRGVSDATATEMLYPMHVVKVRDFLQMTEAEPHQALRARGVAAPYNSEAAAAIFVSHQWCGLRHPDPDFAQLRVLQDAIRRAAAGKLVLSMDFLSRLAHGAKVTVKAADLCHVLAMFIWYDYFSVPQPKDPTAQGNQHMDQHQGLGRAVLSLAAYVECSTYFFVLAPPVLHQSNGSIVDYRSWKSRGWCRLERAARAQSVGATSMVLLERPDTAFLIGPREYLLDAVGEGSFSVEEDKARCAEVVGKLMVSKSVRLLREDKLHDFRRLSSLRQMMLRGLPMDWRESSMHASWASATRDPVDAFLLVHRLSSPTARAGPTTPLLLASVLGDEDLVRGLLGRRASTEERERRNEAAYALPRGARPLTLAARGGHLAVVQVLMEHRADVNARTAIGVGPLMTASAVGSVACISALLEGRADMRARNRMGLGALELAIIFARQEAVRALLAAGASVEASPSGFLVGLTPLHIYSVCGGDGQILQLLLAARAVVDAPVRSAFGPRAVVTRLLSLGHCCGRRGFVTLLSRHLAGATPLMLATMWGRRSEARALLAAGASIGARNARGATPVRLAEEFDVPLEDMLSKPQDLTKQETQPTKVAL